MRIGLATAVATAIAIGVLISTSATPPAQALPSSSIPIPSTFNVFVSPTGDNTDATNCKYNSPAITVPAGGYGTGCKDTQTALNKCVAATGGTTQCDVSIYGGGVDYGINDWNLCFPNWVSQCDTQSAATADIRFYRNPNSTADPQCASTCNPNTSTSHIWWVGPFTYNKSACHDQSVPGAFVPDASCSGFAVVVNRRSATLRPDPQNIVLDSIYFGDFQFSCTSNITLQNSAFGPKWDWHSIIAGGTSCTNGVGSMSNITIRNVISHDVLQSTGCQNDPNTTSTSCGNQHHAGCGPTLNDGFNVTFDGYSNYNCECTNMLLKNSSSGSVHDITIMNSRFGRSGCGLQVDSTVAPAISNLKFIHDTWSNNSSEAFAADLGGGTCPGCVDHSGPVLLGGSTSCTGCLFDGNLGWPNVAFSNGWDAHFNWTTSSTVTCSGTASCSSNTANATYGLASDGTHLLGSSPLLGALATQSWTPANDFDQQTRSSPTSPGADDVPQPSDTTAPTVSMTAPSNGATVSGTITVSATASDNVGVASVQFKLDNGNLQAADTTAPYSVNWDTTTATNGSHTLTAVAVDAAGNSQVSGSVTVTVSNTTTPSNGGSTATCTSPNPCGAVTWTTVNITTDDGTGTNKANSYSIGRPSGLTNASNNLVPVVIWAGGTTTRADWEYEMAHQNFIVASLNKPTSISWNLPYSTGGLANNLCGPSGTAACDDKPYVLAVLADIGPGGAHNQNIDTTKVYCGGDSNAGQACLEFACAANTGPNFSAASSTSIQFRSPSTTFLSCPGATGHKLTLNMDYLQTDTGMQGCATQPITDTNCEPSAISGGAGLRYWGPNTGLYNFGQDISCPATSGAYPGTFTTDTALAGKFTYRRYDCANGTAIRIGRAAATGHAWPGMVGSAGNFSTQNTPPSWAAGTGFDYVDYLWQFFVTYH